VVQGRRGLEDKKLPHTAGRFGTEWGVGGCHRQKLDCVGRSCEGTELYHKIPCGDVT
jgi:hypothetical protein